MIKTYTHSVYHDRITFAAPLYFDANEFIGLVIDEGVRVPSFETTDAKDTELIVVLREEDAELFIESRASARSKTLPLNMVPIGRP